MQKAILVIDMPKNCKECKRCSIATDAEVRSDECPLRRVPERRDEHYDVNDEVDSFINLGYNQCLDDLLGKDSEVDKVADTEGNEEHIVNELVDVVAELEIRIKTNNWQSNEGWGELCERGAELFRKLNS